MTVIPGVLFNGGWDGILRAYSTDSGEELWRFRHRAVVRHGQRRAGQGGSMGAPGATVAGGMLIVGSGYIGTSNGMPGNVLLAFGP